MKIISQTTLPEGDLDDFLRELCEVIIEKNILQSQYDDVCDAAIQFLCKVITIQAKSKSLIKKQEAKRFWKNLLKESDLQIISSDVMNHIKSKMSVKLLYSKLDSLL